MTILRNIEQICGGYAVAHRPAVAGFLGWCGSVPAVELLGSNPGIGLLLVYGWQFGLCGDEPWQKARELVLLPRPEILRELGFPATNSAVRILGKLDVQRISLSHCRKLRALLLAGGDPVKWLRHLSVIRDGAIDLLYYGMIGEKASFELLDEMGGPDYAYDHTLSDKIAAIKRLSSLHKVRVRPFCSMAEVDHAFDMLTRMEKARVPVWSPAHGQIEFPAPPIDVPHYTQRGGICLEPILTPHALYEEAQSQQIGIYQYLPYVANGAFAFYRLLRPERVTVMLMRSPLHGGWVIRDVCGPSNASIKRETLWALAAYLNRRQDRLLQLDIHASEACVDPKATWREAQEMPALFPLPPVPGTLDIVPLVSVSDLAEEGKQQENCVEKYADHVRSGHFFFYRIMTPERATLSIKYCGFRTWRIQQLKGRRNRKVHLCTLRRVESWLSGQPT